MVIDWYVAKFETERMLDASEAWLKPSDDIKKIGQVQVVGLAARRKF